MKKSHQNDNNNEISHEFLVDLNEHASVVNTLRFSPCGKMLASASERQVIIYIGKEKRYDRATIIIMI